MDDRTRVRALLESPKLRTLYANTFYSLTDRIDETGYLEESFVPGRYPGDFARSSGAFVFLMAECGLVDLAERALRFVLDTMKRNRLTRPPHVMGKPRYGENGQLLQKLDMVNQPDGTAHILSAYGELVLQYGRKELLEDYWPMMVAIMDQHADQPYFFSNERCGFPVANVNLFLNTAFEHSREERYWCCFDLLTQSFMGASLSKMARIAERMGDAHRAERWEAQLSRLRDGVRRNLVREEMGKTVYMEMRLPDSNGGTPFEGMGCINFAPIAAGWEALEPQVMIDTVRAVRDKLWRCDPQGTLHFLSKETRETEGFCLETIGKGDGWDIEASRREGEYGHIYDVLQFQAQRHEADLYGECMFYEDGRWKTRDCGNAEQCIWWCWAIARLRETLGMARIPERKDVTEQRDIREKTREQAPLA